MRTWTHLLIFGVVVATITVTLAPPVRSSAPVIDVAPCAAPVPSSAGSSSAESDGGVSPDERVGT